MKYRQDHSEYFKARHDVELKTALSIIRPAVAESGRYTEMVHGSSVELKRKDARKIIKVQLDAQVFKDVRLKNGGWRSRVYKFPSLEVAAREAVSML